MTTNESPIIISDLEKIAHKNLPQNALNYYSSGADGQQTLTENKARLRIRPHMLRGISTVDTSVEFLGRKLRSPIFIAPTAMQKMAHADGELGTARAAREFETCMGLSTLSTCSYEEVAEAAPDLLLVMQLYVYKNRDLSLALIRRAEKAGFKAIMLTVDTPVLGQRIADVRHKFALPQGLTLANYSDVEELGEVNDADSSGLMSYVAKNIEPALSPDVVRWLKSLTDLPIFLKGILSGEDAKQALGLGIDGIIVSNHGGRQLDCVPSTIEALPEVVAAVDGAVDVYLDGGIRRGTDVFKALALGAKAVFIGRPVLWGLAYNGGDGVKTALKILQDELERAMLLSGCATIDEIVPSMVVHESYYWRTNFSKL